MRNALVATVSLLALTSMAAGRAAAQTASGSTAGIGSTAPSQDQPLQAPAAAPAAPTESAAPTEQAAPTALGDIVVTAQRRSESIQRVPISVDAIGGKALAAQGAKDLFQAVTLVPGVVFSRAADDGLALTFRGLGTAARPQAFEQSVALFTDGIFFGKGRLYSTSFFDVDRIEFIKGTQSTLLGKNASVGAISIVTRQPGKDLSVEARAGGELLDGGYTFDVAADLPVSPKLRVRLAAHYNDFDGWVRNDFTGHDGPEQKDLGLRATALFEATDTFRLTGVYQHAENRQIGTNNQLVGTLPAGYGEADLNGGAFSFTGATSDGETRHRITSDIASLKGELDIGTHTLISQTAFIHYSLDNVDDFDFTKDDAVNFLRNESYRQVTQEIRLQSPTGGRLQYMGGIFYLNSHWNSLEGQIWRVPNFPAGTPLAGQLFNGPFFNRFIQDQNAYSGFASALIRITPTLRLAGGARYTHETKKILYGRTPTAPLTIWNTVANPPFDPTPLRHRSNFLDGNVSLEYDVASNVMTYASFGHGSKSGGYVETNTIAVNPATLVNGKVPAALVAAGSAIKDEYTRSYEIGIKSTLLDRRLRLNADLFWTDIKNFQDTVFTGGAAGFITFNGPARSRGGEVELAFQPSRLFQLNGGITYADATAVIQPFDAAGNPIVDSTGNPVFARYRRSQAPRISFNIGTNARLPLNDDYDLTGMAALRHRNSMYNQRQEQFLAKQLTTLDLGVGAATRDDRYGIDFVVRNVTNSKSEDFASPSVDPRFGPAAHVAAVTRLRTLLVTVHGRF